MPSPPSEEAEGIPGAGVGIDDSEVFDEDADEDEVSAAIEHPQEEDGQHAPSEPSDAAEEAGHGEDRHAHPTQSPADGDEDDGEPVPRVPPHVTPLAAGVGHGEDVGDDVAAVDDGTGEAVAEGGAEDEPVHYSSAGGPRRLPSRGQSSVSFALPSEREEPKKSRCARLCAPCARLCAPCSRLKARILRCSRRWPRTIRVLLILFGIVLFPLVLLALCYRRCCRKRPSADEEDVDVEEGRQGSKGSRNAWESTGSASTGEYEYPRSSLKKENQFRVNLGIDEDDVPRKVHARAWRARAGQPADTLGDGPANTIGKPPPAPKGLHIPRKLGSPRSGSPSASPRGGSPRRSFRGGSPRMNSPRGGMGSPRGGMASPRGGMGSPRGGMSSPRGGLSSPRGGSLHGGMSSPRAGSTHARMSSPRGGSVRGGLPSARSGSATARGKWGSPRSGGSHLARGPSSSRAKKGRNSFRNDGGSAQNIQTARGGRKRETPSRRRRKDDEKANDRPKGKCGRLRHCWSSFEDWRHDRDMFFNEVWEFISEQIEEDDYDYENLDEYGEPTLVVHCMPKFIRLRCRVYLAVYWEPFVEMLHRCPRPSRIAQMLLRVTPTLMFLAALSWLGISVYWNSEYDEGDCVIEKLPKRYEHNLNVIATVKARYLVKRSFPPTAAQPEGSVLQYCNTEVSCEAVDYGTSSDDSDDSCVIFQSWSWGDSIDCYYHQDDMYGTNGFELYCLGPPHELFTKVFTAVVAGVILLLALLISGIFAWRRRDVERQAALHAAEQEAEAKEVAEARAHIEEREREEAKMQQERIKAGVSGIFSEGQESEPTDETGDDKLLDLFKSQGSFFRSEGSQKARALRRGSSSEGEAAGMVRSKSKIDADSVARSASKSGAVGQTARSNTKMSRSASKGGTKSGALGTSRAASRVSTQT